MVTDLRLRLTRQHREWLAAAAIAAVVAILYLLIAQPGKGERLSDYTKAYYAAGVAVLHGGPAALWPLIVPATFVNLPIVAWLFAPFAMVSPTLGKLAFTGAGLAAIAASLLLMLQQCPPRRRPLVVLLFAANGPLWYSVMVGNTTHMVLLALLLVLLCLRRGSFYTAGLLVGLITVIKPMFLLLNVYFVWRQNWRLVTAAAIVIGSAVLASVGLFGLDYTIGWYQHCIAAFTGTPLGAANNQSLDAFLLRLWEGQSVLRDWDAHALPGGAKLLHRLLVGAIGLFTLAAMWHGRRPAAGTKQHCSAVELREICLVLNVCILLSPVSWTHYYAILLIPFGLYLQGRLAARDDGVTRGLMLASILMCSIPVRIPWFEAAWLAPISARSFESAWFLGGVLLLFALMRSALPTPVSSLLHPALLAVQRGRKRNRFSLPAAPHSSDA